MSKLKDKASLLAPAGGWSQLKAAVRFGADGVYLATERFGMRARADNFSLESMGAVVDFCHGAQVEIAVTLNTLMDEQDLDLLPSYMETLAAAGVDRFIIGDAGAFALARKYAPSVALSVSTQASVMNSEAAKLWHSLGADRIVCAREMSLKDIAAMRNAIPDDLSLEAFVHGAMCVAYSGRCLLSAAMTGRSGNRGACAQSCRWSYEMVEEKRPGEYFTLEQDGAGSYVLNAQDLNMIAHLEELADAGVDTFKIEGRNKQAFYVATVVGAYRSVMDGGSVELANHELHCISHRPYSTGFYFGDASQSPEQDGYIRTHVHVATVEDCVAASDGTYEITVVCHNRFAPEDVLGVVSPHGVGTTLAAGPLFWYAPADGGKPFVERSPMDLAQMRERSSLVSVPVANRSKERYRFSSSVPLCPGDYLRREDSFGAQPDTPEEHPGV